MRTVLIPIRRTLYVMILAFSLMTGCQKGENFLLNASQESEDEIGLSLGDTLQWLEERMAELDISEEANNEQFKPGQEAAAREEVWITLPNSAEPTLLEADLIDGHFILDGDIILDTESNWRKNQARADARGTAHNLEMRRWPGGVIPFVIDPGHPIANRIQAAINNLNAGTNLTIQPRNNETDYIRFVEAAGCASWVGRQGGEQTINASNNCSIGNMMHEILHAAGLWHEQSRCDRDDFVTIYWNNISNNRESNFGKHCSTLNNLDTWDEKNGIDIGNYDYGSIMHYPSTAFSSNGRRTIVPKGSSKYQIVSRLGMMGQRSGLSDGDVQAINRIYPVKANSSYVIRLRHSQKVWRLGNTNIGTSVHQSSFTGYLSQQFRFVPQSDGSYRIINNWSGHSLEIKGASKSNYASLQQNKYWGGLHQKFEIKHVSGNYYTIRPMHTKKALQTKSNNLGNGYTVHQYSSNNYTYQQVSFIQ